MTIMNSAAEAAAQVIVIDPAIAEIARLTRLRSTTRRQTCTQFVSTIGKGEPRCGLKAPVEYAQELLKEARDINNRLLEEAELEEFYRQSQAHTRYFQQVKAVQTQLQLCLA